MTIPAWLARHLETIGQANPDGVTRRARATRCRRCGAIILAGLDADRCAWPARVDPAPLDRHGELAALLTGRRTYRLWGLYGGDIEIDTRTDMHIAGSPPSDSVIVVAAHECGKPLAELHIPQRRYTPQKTEKAPF